jgi:hypothetical protein
MELPKNIAAGTRGQFTEAFNSMAYAPLDAARFYDEAQKAGWHEARIFPPGTALMFDNSKTATRITVDTDRFGNVKRFRQG